VLKSHPRIRFEATVSVEDWIGGLWYFYGAEVERSAPIDCDWSDDEAAAVDVTGAGAVSVDVAVADGVGFVLIGAGGAFVALVTGFIFDGERESVGEGDRSFGQR
jgi:hypothetical protein